MRHLENCKTIPFSKVLDDLKSQGDKIPDDLYEQMKEISVIKCDENCPIFLRIVTRGKELAEKHGW